MITEQYVEFETAKLLKEKGFDVRCRKGYWHDKQLCLQPCSNSADAPVYACPTQSLVMRWLREVHNLHIELVAGDEFYHGHIADATDGHPIAGVVPFQDTYEQAVEAAILYCLKNLI